MYSADTSWSLSQTSRMITRILFTSTLVGGAHSRVTRKGGAHSRVTCEGRAHSRVTCKGGAHSRVTRKGGAHSRVCMQGRSSYLHVNVQGPRGLGCEYLRVNTTHLQVAALACVTLHAICTVVIQSLRLTISGSGQSKDPFSCDVILRGVL